MAVKRLVEFFKPENYKIFLDIDRKARVFKGKVVATGVAKAEIIYFHEKDLEIISVSTNGVPVNYDVDNKNEEIVINLGKTGTVVLEFEYEAKLTDNMMGIYPSYYEVDGVKKMLIGTQFESHFARQAFPGIDEPEAKATFDLSVKFDEEPNDIIISNMPEVSNENGIHTFETTLKMSSYLLAFVFGELQYKKGKTKSGVEVGAFATKAHPITALDFPVEIAIQAIDFYENYYKMPYPLAHSYHVALPDFSAGAMENWGCITYREVCMLVDPENATEASKQYVATVICHELAHQWFGNLVTMRWWDDLWLNESFANNMEYVSVDAIHPEWHIWDHFSAIEANLALNRDATDGVQSVHVEVNHPDEINTLFDPAIVYAKGSRLMVMLRKWLGDKVFAAGLHNYFEKNKYGNTTGDDLWDALSSASGKDVGTFMHSWVNQPGYPVVDVELIDDTLVLSQRQFFIGKNKDSGRLWQVPLNSNYPELPDILTEARVEIPNFKLIEGKPLLLNEDNAAHYIIHYHKTLLNSILNNLSTLTNIEKFQVLQDRKNLAKAEIISFADVVALLPYFTNENSYIVNEALNQLFAELDIFVDEGTNVEKTYQSLIEKLFKKQYARLGWKKKANESSDDETLRGLILAKMAYAENEDVMKQANSLYAEYTSDTSKIPADVRPIVLSTMIKQNQDDALTRSFFDKYVATNIAEYKGELSTAICYTKSEKMLEYLLDSFKNADMIKPQDLANWYLRLVTKDFSQERVWSWAKDNWEWLKEKLGGDMSFDHFVVYTARTFKTAAKLSDFKAFFEPKINELGLKRNILMGISTIEARVKLIENQKDVVLSTLTDVEANL